MAAIMLMKIMHKAIVKIYYHEHHEMATTFDFTTFHPGFRNCTLFI